jgi:hypothetical protein
MSECDIFFLQNIFYKNFVRSYDHTSFKNNFLNIMAAKKKAKKAAKKTTKKKATKKRA